MNQTELMSQEKIKIGWAFNPEVVKAINDIASSLPKGGLKASCVEAAALMFFEADESTRLRYINRIREAEVNGQMAALINEAVGAKPPMKMAAKITKPSMHGRKSKPDSQA